MNADEIVRALREDAQKQESVLHICDSTRNALKAADLIESLQAQLAASQRRERAAVTAVGRMAEYIVTLGRVDYFLCDNIPKDLHLKHQPKNDGNYDNAPCIKCVEEYFMSGPQDEKGEADD